MHDPCASTHASSCLASDATALRSNKRQGKPNFLMLHRSVHQHARGHNKLKVSAACSFTLSMARP